MTSSARRGSRWCGGRCRRSAPPNSSTSSIANAENAAGGSGITPGQYRHLRAAGVDAVTLGDHVYKKFDIADVLADPAEPAVRPANFPAAARARITPS